MIKSYFYLYFINCSTNILQILYDLCFYAHSHRAKHIISIICWLCTGWSCKFLVCLYLLNKLWMFSLVNPHPNHGSTGLRFLIMIRYLSSECPSGLGIWFMISRSEFGNWLEQINVCISHPWWRWLSVRKFASGY